MILLFWELKYKLVKKFKFYISILIIVAITSCSNITRTINYTSQRTSFSEKESALITQSDSSFPMRVFEIDKISDSLLLKEKSIDIQLGSNNTILNHFTSRLYNTVTDSASMGVGIAAPQVGILRNIIWVQRFDKEGTPFELYLNPKIIQYSKKKQECLEGCLSVPNRMDTLNTRAYAILIEYDKIDGSHQIEMIEDFTAVIFQHEIDHLNGVLYIDHLTKN